MFVADQDGNILMHTGKDVAESAKIPQNLQEEMDSGKDIFLWVPWTIPCTISIILRAVA